MSPKKPVYVGTETVGWTRETLLGRKVLVEAYSEASNRQLYFRGLEVAQSWVREEVHVGQGKANKYECWAVGKE